jgi:uncharacterized phage-associated protein
MSDSLLYHICKSSLFVLGAEMSGPKKYTASDVAKWFVASLDREAGDSITPLKLQKIIYYAQAWALVLLKRPLFDEDFQAWAHGPVVENVYNEYKQHGWNAIPAPAETPEFEEDVEDLLSEVWESYGDFSAKHLERLTHQEAPWKDARGDLPMEARSNSVISKQAMQEYYSALYRDIDGKQKNKQAA